MLRECRPVRQIGQGIVVRKVRNILCAFAAFEFRLARIARFPTALYLAAEPVQPFEHRPMP